MKRFWDKVDKIGRCWLWTASVTRRGYGQFRVGNRMVHAHRVGWEMVNGPVPTGMEVCHRCDTPRCVRAAHLFLGTHAENMQDMRRKGRADGPRHLRGTRNPNARLSDAEVSCLRVAPGTAQEVAKRFGVSVSYVYTLRRKGTDR